MSYFEAKEEYDQVLERLRGRLNSHGKINLSRTFNVPIVANTQDGSFPDGT
jgi:hypothetical protein